MTTTDLFKHDYISIDEYGIKDIRCMASGNVVAHREEHQSEKYPGKTSFKLMRHSDYREIPHLLADNSISFLIFCDEYKGTDLTPEQLELVSDQIKRAKIMELKHSGKTDDFIEKVMANIERKKVIRRLTNEEVSERFSNTVLK